ncbi:hypothetical protein BGZ52_007748 [Haplosporangium bisporale]|nr:hypothetical protein BGZ52_007748 [Haplosporangium bisporale]
MDMPPVCSSPEKTAVVLLGNAGAGKSTLLTQLGAKTFKSGATFRKGFTKDVYEEEIELKGKRVLLIDVPGLYEPSDKETQYNAEKLTEALSRGYNYKLYFVMKASNRGPDDKELVMISKINNCIKRADEADTSCVSFRIIVNQIMSKEVHALYQEHMAGDNCEALFQSLDIPGFSFDIKVDKVMLLMFDEEKLEKCEFTETLTEDVDKHSETAIVMFKLRASNDDLTLFEAAVLTSYVALPAAMLGGLGAGLAGLGVTVATGVAVTGGLAVSAMGGTAWLLYKGSKMAYRAAAKEE